MKSTTQMQEAVFNEIDNTEIFKVNILSNFTFRNKLVVDEPLLYIDDK